jgi:hypothetical protein
MSSEDETTLTTCGTPETMAPEVVLGKPYGMKVG